MRIRSVSDLLATIVAWFPILAFFVFMIWLFSVSAMNLETRTVGSEVFVSNEEAPSPWATVAPHETASSSSVSY